MRTIAPVSPGEMLDEEFLKPLGLAKDIGVPPQRIDAITDLRLCRYFGLSRLVAARPSQGLENPRLAHNSRLA